MSFNYSQATSTRLTYIFRRKLHDCASLQMQYQTSCLKLSVRMRKKRTEKCLRLLYVELHRHLNLFVSKDSTTKFPKSVWLKSEVVLNVLLSVRNVMVAYRCRRVRARWHLKDTTSFVYKRLRWRKAESNLYLLTDSDHNAEIKYMVLSDYLTQLK